MTSTVPFFLSRIIGAKVFDPERNFVGTVKDLLLSADLYQPGAHRKTCSSRNFA